MALNFDRLLNRDQIGGDDSSLDEEDDGLLKAFKVFFLTFSLLARKINYIMLHSIMSVLVGFASIAYNPGASDCKFVFFDLCHPQPKSGRSKLRHNWKSNQTFVCAGNPLYSIVKFMGFRLTTYH